MIGWLRHRWLVFRLGVHFGVFAFVLISLVSCFPYIGGVDGLRAAEAGSDVSHGELSRRIDSLEELLAERRITALEVKVAANTTMLWAALAGLAALVAETFGRILSLLVPQLRRSA